MPITITPAPPHALVGPGLITQFQSDFIGPLPSGTAWTVQLTTDIEGLNAVTNFQRTQNTSGLQFQWWVGPNEVPWTLSQFAPRSGDSVYIQAQLKEPGVVAPIDSGTKLATLETSSGLPAVIADQGHAGQGALTPAQAQQLLEVNQSVALTQTLDALTLIDLTNGPSSGPVNAQLPSFIFGVLVRIAAVPVDLTPQTPDGNYWVPTLATVRIFRGADLWIRAPVHTSSKIVSLLGEGIISSISALVAVNWLLQMSVQVNFLPGVTGEVFLMRFP